MVCFKLHSLAEDEIACFEPSASTKIHPIRIASFSSNSGSNSNPDQHTTESIGHGFLRMTEECMTVFVSDHTGNFVIASRVIYKDTQED